MSFSFKFSADGSEFTRGLSKMKGEVKAFAKSAGGMMLGAFATGKIIGGLKKMSDELDRVGKLSQRFDVSAESIQRLGHAAELNGSNFEKLAKGMSNANRMAQESLNGNKRAAASFEAMGISASDFLQMPLDKQIGALSDGFIKAEQNARGLEAGAQVLGGSVRELIPLLRQGSTAIKEQGDSAGVASEKTIQQVQKFNDTITTLKSKFFGLFMDFINLLDEAGAGFAVFAVIAVGSLKLIGDQFATLWKLTKSAHRLDFGGVKSALKEMETASAISKAKILADIEAIHKARNKKAEHGGLTGDPESDDGTGKSAAKDARGDRLKKIAQIEKDMAAARKKAEFEALTLEGKRQQLMSERIDAAMKLDKQVRSVDFDLHASDQYFESDEYLKELELKKNIFEIDKKIAGVEGKKKAEELKIGAALAAADLMAKEKAEQEQEARDSEMGGLKRGGVESGVISSSLRSIGGGGSAVVTRDPALQIAKRSERILELIAANTAAARDDNEGKGGQKEF